MNKFDIAELETGTERDGRKVKQKFHSEDT